MTQQSASDHANLAMSEAAQARFPRQVDATSRVNEPANSRAYTKTIDDVTRQAVHAFLQRLSPKYHPVDAFLYGSRARGTHREDSDADLAVILKGRRRDRASVGMEMAGIAADVLVLTGVLISPLPLWRCELRHPEQFGNPSLIDAIRRDGLRL